jgi:hypothetical protein
LSVAATGTAPLRYQWQCNGTNLAGATKASLSLTGVTIAKSGSYSVTITNSAGSVTSDAAILAVVPPAPTISSPAANFQTMNSTLLIQGHAAANAGVTAISYMINDTLPQTATGTTTWSVTVPLNAGTNTFRIKALNAFGESKETVIHYFRLQTNILHVTISGSGAISPNWTNQALVVGRSYSLTAVPGRGQIFAGWSGGVESSTSTLRFVMAPGLQLQANFVTNLFIGAAGTYNGLFRDPFYLAHQSAGFITMTVSTNQSFSGKILLNGATNIFSGKFDASGHATFSLPRKVGGALDANWQLDLTGGSDQITGTLGNDIFTANVIADRATFTAAHSATAFSGAYTVLIPGGTNATTAPSGYGYGIANVSAAGVASASGFLGDGTAFNSSVSIAKDGRWPFYTPLYSGQGSITGWLQFTNSPIRIVNGTLFWFKNPVTTGNLYRGGFSVQSDILGSSYTKPPRGQRAINLGSADIVLLDGNLDAPLTNTFTLSTNNILTITGTNSISLKLNITNGVLSGTFVHPVTHATTPIKGAVSQWYGGGAGYLLGTNQSGAVLLNSNE